MNSKTIFLALTVSTVVGAGLLLPSFIYAEQIGSTMQATFGPIASNVHTTAPILTVRGHGGPSHGGGAWHGAARAFHGGRGFYGRGFYGGYGYPYYGDQVYAEPSCDSVVWDSDLDEWVCSDDYVTY